MLNYEKYALTRGNDMKKSTLATLAGLLGYSIFGFSFLFSKVALGLTTPLVLLSVRFLTAFLVMNLLVLSGKMRLSLGESPSGCCCCWAWCSRWCILSARITASP